MIKQLDGDTCHDLLQSQLDRKLAFSYEQDYDTWKQRIHQKLVELLRIQQISQNICPININIEEEKEFDTYRRIRFTYESECENHVPAYLLIPKAELKSYPLAIALQGHTTGFHNSIGVAKYEDDLERYSNSAFGLQAVEHGFAALCIEQRGMGETRSKRYPGPRGVHACSFTAMTALNLGRTILGERVWDVSRGIDAMEELNFPEIDLTKIMILGNSGGGTASYYAACCDERIDYCAPACSFCSYRTSIMDILHCVCNFIPESSLWFEMEDLAGMIAPRKLTVLTGVKDKIFPIEGVREAFELVKKIYKKAGAEENCRLVEMPEGHYWCEDVAWEAIMEDTNTLGWHKAKEN